MLNPAHRIETNGEATASTTRRSRSAIINVDVLSGATALYAIFSIAGEGVAANLRRRHE
jgi:hypothetical protein